MPDLLGYLLYIALYEIHGLAGDDGREERSEMTEERTGDDRRERGNTGDDGEWNL